MTYAGYVIAAYAAFAVVMLWDALMPQWQIARALRAARLRARRDAARRASPAASGAGAATGADSVLDSVSAPAHAPSSDSTS